MKWKHLQTCGILYFLELMNTNGFKGKTLGSKNLENFNYAEISSI